MIQVEIDNRSGFCFGVVNAIHSAERELNDSQDLFCLGDIVHNSLEVERLEQKGMHTINHAQLADLTNSKVLLRAHGEPPATYALAEKNKITLIDATCPVVLKLQKRIHDLYQSAKHNHTQIVIYGKQGHAEVNGLVGQTEETAIVIEKPEDLDRLDYSKNTYFFSQTTMSLEGFRQMIEAIEKRMDKDAIFQSFDTICRQVANRIPNIKVFAAKHDLVYFVAGQKSSNGKLLFKQCLEANPNTVFISSPEEITNALPSDIKTVGVCGATSTPKWLMEKVAKRILAVNKD